MNYQEATNFLFTQLPMFQNVGVGAYKPGLGGVLALSEAFGNPHEGLRAIHVAGTNGKGSTSSLLAAVLQAAGLRVGLFTSPHLVDFRERIRVGGEMISREAVVDFVERYQALAAENRSSEVARPSFFELTTVMAFEHFRREKVDVAVVEVGLGGRLDSTNIIMPELSVITNISLDHTAMLGHTEAEIAREKAGIIKAGVPIVIGEAAGDVRAVFERTAARVGAPIYFAEDSCPYADFVAGNDCIIYRGTEYGDVSCELTGDCQPHNAATALTALKVWPGAGVVTAEAVRAGFSSVTAMTGLMGRWTVLGRSPLVVCDTGHNPGGWQYLSRQIRRMPGRHHVVLGFVNDKDISFIFDRLPTDASYYFVRPGVQRARCAEELRAEAAKHGFDGQAFASVAEGYEAALKAAAAGDSIFVGGSTFVVADLLSSFDF